MSKTKVRTTVLSQDEYFGGEISDPAKFFIQNALGDFIFYHCRTRAAAQAAVDEEYGKGKYTVRTSKLESTGGELSARGYNTRKCFSPRLKGLTPD